MGGGFSGIDLMETSLPDWPQLLSHARRVEECGHHGLPQLSPAAQETHVSRRPLAIYNDLFIGMSRN